MEVLSFVTDYTALCKLSRHCRFPHAFLVAAAIAAIKSDEK